MRANKGQIFPALQLRETVTSEGPGYGWAWFTCQLSHFQDYLPSPWSTTSSPLLTLHIRDISLSGAHAYAPPPYWASSAGVGTVSAGTTRLSLSLVSASPLCKAKQEEDFRLVVPQ